jgi:hypothetical protein
MKALSILALLVLSACATEGAEVQFATLSDDGLLASGEDCASHSECSSGLCSREPGRADACDAFQHTTTPSLECQEIFYLQAQCQNAE